MDLNSDVIYFIASAVMNLNSGIIYLIAGTVMAVVFAQAVFFLIKAYREGLKIGMSKDALNKAITSSAVFSILPSLGILVTMFGLIKFLGIPFSWLRLSVIGSLMYETVAADAAAQAAAGTSLANAQMTPEIFVTIALVMSVGIILGGIVCIFGLKKYSALIKKARPDGTETQNDNEANTAPAVQNAFNAEKQTDITAPAVQNALNTEAQTDAAVLTKPSKKKLNVGEIGNLISAAVFIALCSAYIGGAVGKAFGGFRIDTYTSVIPFISMLVAVACMAVLMKLQKKRAWIQSFALSISMLVGMVSAIPVSFALGALFG
ncbi:MAG: DUF5058 family protein [Clostridiales bacterium]|jgi:hypothetical protein|nr:DUF5058 family protein [Clostridiales bacterium]